MWAWVDLAIIGIIALSVLTGLVRGFVKEFIALCVWILAIWLAFHYSPALESWLQNYILDKTIRTIAAFVLILISVLVIGGVINALLSIIMKRTGLGGPDRILGMAFGFIRGIFIVALIMVVIKMTSLPYQQYAKESQLYGRFDPIVQWMYSLMPDFIKQIKTFDRQIPPTSPAETSDKTKIIDLSNDLEFSDD